MAQEHVSTGMDYAEHERSYATFVKLTTLGTVACLNIVLVLLITGVYSGAWGGVFLTLTLIGIALGFLANHSWVPSGIVFALTAVFTVLVLAG